MYIYFSCVYEIMTHSRHIVNLRALTRKLKREILLRDSSKIDEEEESTGCMKKKNFCDL